MTRSIQGTSRENIYQELGLESSKSNRWHRRLNFIFKIMKEEASIKLIPKRKQTLRTRSNHKPNYSCRTDCFKYSFLSSTLNDWFNSDGNLRNSESISILKSNLLSFIRPIQNNIYNVFDPKGLKFLTNLRLGFSHLNEHRFRHNFQGLSSPLYSFSMENEDTTHCLLSCHHFHHQRIDLTSSKKSICSNFEFKSDDNKKDMLLYGDSFFDENKFILEATIDIIKILKNSRNLFLNNVFIIMENMHLYTIFKGTKPPFFLFFLFLLIV